MNYCTTNLIILLLKLLKLLAYNKLTHYTEEIFTSPGYNLYKNVYFSGGKYFYFNDKPSKSILSPENFFGPEFSQLEDNYNLVVRNSSSREKLYAHKKLGGATILMFDTKNPYVSHLFHFLEQLLPLLSIGIEHGIPIDTIKRIIFPNLKMSQILHYQGKILNEHFFNLLLPKVEIIAKDEWNNMIFNDTSKDFNFTTTNCSIWFEKLLTADRNAAHNAHNLVNIWNKMMAPVLDITKQNFQHIKSALLQALSSESGEAPHSHHSSQSSISTSHPNLDSNHSVINGVGNQPLSYIRTSLPLTLSLLANHPVIRIDSKHKIRNKEYDRRLVRLFSRPINVTVVHRNSREVDLEDFNLMLRHLSESRIFRVTVVKLERLLLRDQIKIVSESGVLIGTHGMGLLHTLWLNQPPRLLVEIFPPDSYHNDYQLMAAINSCRHFAYDSKYGFFHGSQYLFDPICPSQLYTPHGTLRPTFKLYGLSSLITRIFEFSLYSREELLLPLDLIVPLRSSVNSSTDRKHSQNTPDAFFPYLKNIQREYLRYYRAPFCSGTAHEQWKRPREREEDQVKVGMIS